jgi:hypothetical protein
LRDEKRKGHLDEVSSVGITEKVRQIGLLSISAYIHTNTSTCKTGIGYLKEMRLKPAADTAHVIVSSDPAWYTAACVRVLGYSAAL